MARRVIMVQQDPRYDLSSLEPFGVVEYLLPRRVFITEVQTNLETLQRAMEQITFDPELDLVCMTGPFVLVGMMMWIIGRKYKSIKVLIFNAPADGYVERAFTLE